MPLQIIPLQQRPRSAVSEALTPRRTAGVSGAMPQGEGFMERQQRLQEVEAERKFQEKMMKLQHEQEMEKAKFAAGLKEDALKGITAGQALGRAPTGAAPTATPTAGALTKENMPEAAMEMWKFISTLEPDSQKFYIKQLKEKELGTGGYIEAGGVRKEMPGSLGTTDTVIKKTEAPMKDRFDVNTKTGEIYDTTTGEVMGSKNEPEKVVDAINKQANADALAISKTGAVSFEDAKHDALIDYGVDEEVAADMARIKGIPKEFKEKRLFSKAIDWIKNLGKKQPPVPGYEVPIKGAGKPTFNEANVTALIDVISDDVTTAERAHLKGQGATDSDIDEAIRRKGSK